MNFSKMTNYLILVPFLFLICGCSIPTEFFIQNHTEAVQTITITYKKSTLSDLDKKIKFDFVNEIIDPRAFRKISNLSTLEKRIVNDSIISIDIPEKSTVRIEKTHNYRWYYTIENVEIQNQKHTIVDLIQSSEKIKTDYFYIIH